MIFMFFLEMYYRDLIYYSSNFSFSEQILMRRRSGGPRGPGGTQPHDAISSVSFLFSDAEQFIAASDVEAVAGDIEWHAVSESPSVPADLGADASFLFFR